MSAWLSQNVLRKMPLGKTSLGETSHLPTHLTAVPALGQWCQSLWGRFLWGLSLGALHAGCAPRELCAAPLAASRAADAVPWPHQAGPGQATELQVFELRPPMLLAPRLALRCRMLQLLRGFQASCGARSFPPRFCCSCRTSLIAQILASRVLGGGLSLRRAGLSLSIILSPAALPLFVGPAGTHPLSLWARERFREDCSPFFRCAGHAAG